MQHETSDIYERITKQIIEAIEAGAGKFRMPWHVTGAERFTPMNVTSERPYRGVNVLSLWVAAEARSYNSGLWGTYNQWQQFGAQVRKGEKAAPVVFWKFPEPKGNDSEEAAEDDEAPTSRGVLAKGYYVFNADQVEGYTPPARVGMSAGDRIERADAFFVDIGADIRHGGSVACYESDADIIRMPMSSAFHEAAGYYAVLGHETTHWSGAPHRLNRTLRARFGSEAYAMEELVAELGAAFLCATLGISNTPRPDHAAYLATWLAVLRRDKRAIFSAASQAQKAVDWMTERAGLGDELAA
jgi:antirestriction protein ArdC